MSIDVLRDPSRSAPIRSLARRLTTFLADLKRRRVFRMAVMYVAGGYVVIEAAETIFPIFEIADLWTRAVAVGVMMGFPVVVVLTWAFDLTPEGLRLTPNTATEPDPPLPDDGSVAVLPFAVFGGSEESAGFADGLTEEILNSLGGIEGIQVVARTSSFAFKGREADIREIGSALGVRSILEGSVRYGADRVRVTAQLIRTSDGFHLLSSTYDRPLEDPLGVQEEVSRAIAHAVRGKLAPPPTEDPEADTRVAERLAPAWAALDTRTPQALADARERFEAAVREWPERAEARAGLAEALALLGDCGVLPPAEAFPAAVAEARRAVELDEGCARGHSVLGFARLLAWDLAGVERSFRRALELEAGDARTRRWYALYLTATARLEEAVLEAEEALRLEPGSASAHASLGGLHYYARDPERALTACARALELAPEATFAQALQGMAHALTGRHSEAKRVAKDALARAGADPLLMTVLGLAQAGAGEERDARAILDRLEAPAARPRASDFCLAALHAGLGEAEPALERLQRATAAHDGWLLSARVHPWMDPLRSHSRFAELLADAGLEGGRRRPALSA